jgi:hypothetical protein
MSLPIAIRGFAKTSIGRHCLHNPVIFPLFLKVVDGEIAITHTAGCYVAIRASSVKYSIQRNFR